MEHEHAAYSDPSFPANQLIRHIGSESGRALWAEPSALAAAIFEVVSRDKRIPIRVPLGADAWGMVGRDVDAVKQDLDEFKEVSMSVGDAKQMDTIRFLHK